MAKHRTFLGKIFGPLADSFTSGLNSLGGLFSSFFNRFTGAGLTNAQRDSADLEYTYQQRLNEQEFERKKEFYNMYESPAAMVRQYKNAGLNPMLLAGGGASQSATGGIGSAGSVDVPDSGSLDPSALLSAITGLVMKNKEMKIGQQNADTAKYNAETQRMLAGADIKLKEKQSIRQGIENEFLPELFGVQIKEGEASVEQKQAQAAQLRDLISSQEFQRKLMEKDLKIKDNEIAIQECQKLILEAKARYADRYEKAVADYQGALVTLTTAQANGQYYQNEFLRRTLDNRVEQAEYDMYNVLYDTATKAKIFTGKGFERQVEGKMTTAERTQFWGETTKDVVKSVVQGAATMYGAQRFGSKTYSSGGVPPGYNPTGEPYTYTDPYGRTRYYGPVGGY